MQDVVAVYLSAVDFAPGMDDVDEDKGDEQADDGHGAEGEFAAAGVGYGEGGLQVGIGGVVGRVVPAYTDEQGEDGEDGADADGPNASSV